MKKSFDKFLEGEERMTVAGKAKFCSICGNPQLAEDVARYANGKKDGTILHSIHYVWLNYFAPQYGMASCGPIRRHIRLHLGIRL